MHKTYCESNMSNMFKVNNKDTRTTSGASIVNFEHILQFILLVHSKTTVSDNNFFFNNCEKYIVLLAGKILLGYMFSSLFTQH